MAYAWQQVAYDVELSSGGIERAALQVTLNAFWLLLTAPTSSDGPSACIKAWLEDEPALPVQPPPAAAQQQLAVRCAQALGTRSSANSRCASLAGASEAAAGGLKCGGCMAVRYRGEACSRADRLQHRLACRLIIRAAVAAAAAAGGGGGAGQ